MLQIHRSAVSSNWTKQKIEMYVYMNSEQFKWVCGFCLYKMRFGAKGPIKTQSFRLYMSKWIFIWNKITIAPNKLDDVQVMFLLRIVFDRWNFNFRFKLISFKLMWNHVIWKSLWNHVIVIWIRFLLIGFTKPFNAETEKIIYIEFIRSAFQINGITTNANQLVEREHRIEKKIVHTQNRCLSFLML